MNIYRESIKFKLNNKDFIMYNKDDGTKAFLKNVNNKFYYPSFEELVEIVSIFNNHKSFLFYEDDSNIYKSHKNNNGSVKTSRKRRFSPKVIIKIKGIAIAFGITAGLSAAIASAANCSNSNYLSTTTDSKRFNFDDDLSAEYSNLSDIKVENDAYFDDEDISILYDAKYVALYSNKYIDKYLEIHELSSEEVISIINSNENFDDDFKRFVIDFYTKMKNYYGDGFDDRIFAKNIQNLRVEYQHGDIDLGSNALAIYNYEENTITLLDSFDYNDEVSKLIARHELCHATNMYLCKKNSEGFKVKSVYCPQGSGTYAAEAMNVIFSTNPFLDEYSDELKANMGYGITTNALRVVVDSVDYDVSESTRHNISSLKEVTESVLPEGVDGEMFYDLMDAQTIEYLYPSIEMEDTDRVTYYTILTNMYINKNISSNMTYDEIMSLKQEFINSLVLGLASPEIIDEDTINTTFNYYLNENNITIGKTK